MSSEESNTNFSERSSTPKKRIAKKLKHKAPSWAKDYINKPPPKGRCPFCKGNLSSQYHRHLKRCLVAKRTTQKDIELAFALMKGYELKKVMPDLRRGGFR